MMQSRRPRQPRAILLAGIAVTTLSLAACGSGHDESPEVEGAPVAVRTQVLQALDEPATLAVSGQVVARNRVEIASRIAGRILELPVAEGDAVRRGDVLARIDSPELSAALAEATAAEEAAEAALKVAERQAERMERLAAERVVTPRDLELTQLSLAEARAGARRAGAARRMAEENFGYAVLRAPHDGVIIARPARPGDLAAPGVRILTLEDAAGPEIRITLSADSDILPFVGMAAAVAPSGDGASRVHATVARVSPNADLNTIVAYLSAQGSGLVTGTFVDVHLEAPGTVAALRLPAESLVRRGPLVGAYIVHEGRAVLRWVRLDATGRVQAGVAAGDTVVLAPSTDLKDGDRVEVRS